ncbi:MAG: ATP-dependent helicase RecG [Actinomycetota bacterium]|nr:ATP-dependent helicase RecG [Actinomycetota bacterium]
MPRDLSSLIDALRAAGGDFTDVEVKTAAGGLPESLAASLSALANLPGGGTIILGLDERTGFRPAGLKDPQLLKQGLATRARAFVPPVRLTIDDGLVDGQPVVIAKVHECDPSTKPCRVASTGIAYLRGYDGDFALSTVEEQGFLAARTPPHFDRAPVAGAGPGDLDPELLASFVQGVRERDRRGLGRFDDDRELVRRAGVTDDDGRPTTAGLLALGRHPQEFFPRFVIQVAAESHAGDPAGVRARDQATITGPIPHMLDTAMAWARGTFRTSIVTSADGNVHDQPEYPLVAFRELIANALVHRDLDHWSAGTAIEVRLRHDRLVVTSPGGLYGITVDRLGHEGVTSARNARLVAICQHVKTPDTGSRVIEALASGIPIVTEALAERGLPPATFVDNGIRFTALLRHRAPNTRPAMNLTATQLAIYQALGSRPRDATALQPELGLADSTIRKGLHALRLLGLVHQDGGRGRPTTYRRTVSD